jgi:hypothetical protein
MAFRLAAFSFQGVLGLDYQLSFFRLPSKGGRLPNVPLEWHTGQTDDSPANQTRVVKSDVLLVRLENSDISEVQQVDGVLGDPHVPTRGHSPGRLSTASKGPSLHNTSSPIE